MAKAGSQETVVPGLCLTQMSFPSPGLNFSICKIRKVVGEITVLQPFLKFMFPLLTHTFTGDAQTALGALSPQLDITEPHAL